MWLNDRQSHHTLSNLYSYVFQFTLYSHKCLQTGVKFTLLIWVSRSLDYLEAR